MISPVFALKIKPVGSEPRAIDQAPVAGMFAAPGVTVCGIAVIAVPRTALVKGEVVVISGLVTTVKAKVSSS